MIDSLIDGLKLMVLGMGAVFLFLGLMVFVITLAAKLLAPFAGILEPPAPAPRKKKDSKDKGAGDDKSLTAAIIAAVHQYREDNE